MVGTTPLALGSRNVIVEPFSGRKVLRATKLLKSIARGAPEIIEAWQAFTREYQANTKQTLSRTEALFEFGPRLAHLTDEDWAASGNQITLPESPSTAEQVAAVFPLALDLAEEQILRLLALVAMPNAEVKERRGNLEEALDELAEEILDAPFEQLMELAVLGGEAVDEQYTRKAEALGDRMGNALRLVGIDLSRIRRQPTPRPGSSIERPTSSSDSPTPSDGPLTPLSTPTTDSSSDSTTD